MKNYKPNQYTHNYVYYFNVELYSVHSCSKIGNYVVKLSQPVVLLYYILLINMHRQSLRSTGVNVLNLLHFVYEQSGNNYCIAI